MVQLVTHNGQKILIEDKKITLAKVFVEREVFSDSKIEYVFVHPRYLVPELRYEIVEIWGRKKGRTLYVLDKPVYEDHTGVINFKGAGADTKTDDLLISDSEIPFREMNVGRNERIWGGLKLVDAFEEGERDTWSLPFIINESILEFPNRLSRNICKASKQFFELAQLIRIVNTNIRFDDIQNLTLDDLGLILDPVQLAIADFKMLSGIRELEKRGRSLHFCGSISANRYVDGTFTDSENISYSNFPGASIGFVVEAIQINLQALAQVHRELDYLTKLEECTKLQYSKLINLYFEDKENELFYLTEQFLNMHSSNRWKNDKEH